MRFSSMIFIALLVHACASPRPEPPVKATPIAAKRTPPATEKRPVTDTYHGVKVTEAYRWLENKQDQAVRHWAKAQYQYARSHLDLLPAATKLRTRFDVLLKGDTWLYYSMQFAAGRYFAMKWAPPAQQSLLMVTRDAGDESSFRTLVDPNRLDPSGGTTMDWYAPSHNGKLVAVSLSKDGTEVGDVHVYDVDSGKEVDVVIPRANTGTAGGHLAWAPDDQGFYYTRHPRGNERPEADKGFYQQLYFHALGTPTEDDRYELGKDLPRIAEIEVSVDTKSGRVLATVQNGDGGEFAHYLRSPHGTWQQFSEFGDRIVQAVFGRQDDLLLISRQDAPRGKLLRLPIATLGSENATVVIPEGEDTLVSSFWGAPSLVVTASHLYVTYQLGGPSTLRAFTHDGTPVDGPAIPPVSSASGLVALEGDDLLFSVQSLVEPRTCYRFRAVDGTTTTTAFVTHTRARFPQVEVVREFATSRDGTQVPVNIIKPAGVALDGSHPMVLYGYGGYGVSLTPRFRPTHIVLLENGILYAEANLRGGGEYGEAWYRGGSLTHKQNVFDDFAAVARHLVARGYTSRDRLALQGVSNGGLLMGAMITQHPKLAKAVVSHVGIYDMLRVELQPNGEFNATEFGTVKNPEHFRALRAYSPYHNVKDGVAYPAILMLTGANDPRVDPMHSRKMAARLQAANAGPSPILLRTSDNTGHGGGTPLDEQIDQLVDEFGFFFLHLGVDPEAGEVQGERRGDPAARVDQGA